MKINVMSFNTQHCMNYISKQIDFASFAEAIKHNEPLFVGLNEMRMAGPLPEFTDQVPALAEAAGYPYWYFAKAIDVDGTSPYGNGLLSKVPILFAETILVPDPVKKESARRHYETRCLLHAKLDVPGGLDVFIIHFGLNPDEQENAVQTVVENLTESRCILMGDFNVIPEDPVLQPIREKLFDTADLFAAPLGSYPSDNPDRKIDYIFTSHDLKSFSADIPALVVSDHRPYVAQVEI